MAQVREELRVEHDQLRAELAELGESPTAVADVVEARRMTHLTVRDLASELGYSVHQTYRLLEGGAIPGAFKTHPSSPQSRWYIPADAACRFHERGVA